MRTAVHVQHLSGDVASFGKVNDSVGNVLRLRNRPHGRESLHNVLFARVMKTSVNNSGSYRVKADVAFRIFAGEAQDNRIQSSLGDRWNGGWNTRDGVGGQRCRDAC